ncbi:hypothetical protein B0H11DRAFT_2235722 [Mycena galericulata]|nr:hypothetical protein B0H11DRAFT_2235722 [Mycena galericulata]
MTSKKHIEDEERRFMANFRCSTYHARHREERNSKTRARMAALRAREAGLPQEEQERRREARNTSAAKYRANNAWRLAKAAREARYRARIVREQAKAQARMEEARLAREEQRAAEHAAEEAKAARHEERRRRRGQRLAQLRQCAAEAEAALALLEMGYCDPQRGEQYMNIDFLYFANEDAATASWYESAPAMATPREMGPGARHNSLDEGWLPWNYNAYLRYPAKRHVEYLVLDDHRQWWDGCLLDFELGLVSITGEMGDAGLELRWVKTFLDVLSLALVLCDLDVD